MKRKRGNGGFRRRVRRRRPPMGIRAARRRRGRTTRLASFNPRTGGFLGIESKFFDVESSADAFALAWATMEPATTNLSAIAQGDGESNRDGRKYEITSIHVKGQIAFDPLESQVSPPDDLIARVCLVLDNQTNGAQLTATDVMDGGLGSDWLAFRNLQFTKRFRVLRDLTFDIPVARTGMNEGAINLFANGSAKQTFNWNVRFNPPLQVTMSGTTADIANVTDKSLHMIGVGSSTSGNLTYQSRVRFRG